jgi:hypothetical protein
MPERTSSTAPFPRLTLACALVLTLGLAQAPAIHALPPGTPGDWPQFGYDARHDGFNPQETTLGPGIVPTLHKLYAVPLAGTVDNAPVFLSDVATPFGLLDVLYMTTMDGVLLAVDAATGRTLWSRQPSSGGPGYTTSTPALDPNRRFVYSYGLEGQVHKYQVGDGTEVTTGGWPQRATLKPQVEKSSPGLAVATAANGHTYLYVANGGYPGDAGDYQGHVTAIDISSSGGSAVTAAAGTQRVWNANCSDQAVHFTLTSPDCPHVQSAVWARAGVVYDSDLDRIYLATGNGEFGNTNWGDSVIALRPDASSAGGQPVDSYTPTNFQQLADDDLDLGSTAPALLPAVPHSRYPHLAVQGGKDGQLRLLNLDDLSGQGKPGRAGGELQTLPVPQGGVVLTALAVWIDPVSGIVWIFVANNQGLSGLQVVADAAGTPSLTTAWSWNVGGTSPIVVDATLFYVGRAGLQALAARRGAVLWSDPAPGAAGIHWQSPIAVDGRVYVPDGGGNLWAYAASAPSHCTADATTLCLQGGRFQVRATWQTADGVSGSGQAIGLSGDTGYFWFFSAANVEMVLKVIDGCQVGGHYWVFAGGLSNVDVVVTVVDTRDGSQRVYRNPQGAPFAPIQDTAAFADCP